jgi:molybdate transport system substrate-binding protein
MLGSALIVALLAASFVGCTRQPTPPASGTSAEPEPAPGGFSGTLKVLVPCGQLAPFKEAQAIFMDKYPDVTVEEDVQNINVFRDKLLEDKIPDGDVFLDMGDTVAEELKAAGKTVAGTETPYAQNWIGLVVPEDNPAGITKFEDLAKPSVKSIALAQPDENSNGYYAREALQAAGMWDDLEKAGKIVTVPQPVQLRGLVAAKKVDVAFIYSVCANEAAVKPAGKGGEPEKLLPEKVTMIARVPEELYTPFYCTATVLATTQNEATARKFVEFLATQEASEIWQKFEFGPAPSGEIAAPTGPEEGAGSE